MHKIDENITKEYLKEINFSFEGAFLAIAPGETGFAKDGISEFCNWKKTTQGQKFWEKQWRKGKLSPQGHTIVSDMMLVSLGMTPEEAALNMGTEGTRH